MLKENKNIRTNPPQKSLSRTSVIMQKFGKGGRELFSFNILSILLFEKTRKVPEYLQLNTCIHLPNELALKPDYP